MNILFKVKVNQNAVDYEDKLNKKTIYSVIHIDENNNFLLTDGKEFIRGVDPEDCTIYTKLSEALK